LKDVSFLRAIDYGDLVLFIVGQGDKNRLEGQPEVIAHFKKKFEIQKIQLVEYSTKLGQYVENLVTPQSCLDSINSMSRRAILNIVLALTGTQKIACCCPKSIWNPC